MIVVPEKNTLLLKSRNPGLIQQTIRKSRLVDIRGHNIAVKHGVEEVQVLRNLGIKAPSPLLYRYEWPGRFKPYDHQRETAAFMTYHRRGFILNDMGTGKTASILWGLDFLMREGLAGRTLIASPLSTLEKVWRDEIFHVLMHRTAIVLHGTRQQRFDRLEKEVDFYIVNHDGIQIIADVVAQRNDIDTLVVDEASVFRNGQTSRYKVLRQLLKKRPDMRLYLATGTPCPNAPTDAWALAKLVNPSKVPDYFGQFRDKVMVPVGPYKWRPRAGAYETAYQAMQPAIRYKKEDCIDLPPLTFESRDVELTPEQKKAFSEMRSRMQMEAADAKLAGEPISAVNAADQVNKLRQILCGAIKIPGDERYTVLDHGPRTDTLVECIEQASAKVLVVVPFKGIINTLADEVKQKGYSCAVLNGDVPPKQRNEIITAFKGSADPHVLLMHPKVASHGLNLVEADVMVFYAPIYSNDEFLQVIERFNRPGQTRKMTVIRLGAHPLEWKIYELLAERKDSQDTILRLYEESLQD